MLRFWLWLCWIYTLNGRRIDILTILSFLTHKYDVSLNLFRSYLISFIHVLYFFFFFLHKDLILLDSVFHVLVNGTTKKNFFPTYCISYNSTKTHSLVLVPISWTNLVVCHKRQFNFFFPVSMPFIPFSCLTGLAGHLAVEEGWKSTPCSFQASHLHVWESLGDLRVGGDFLDRTQTTQAIKKIFVS